MKESKIKTTRKRKVQFIVTAEAEYHKGINEDLTDLEAFANLYYTENNIKTVLNDVFKEKNFTYKSYLSNLEFADSVGKHVTE
jgi:hypothetical protein